jgi:two-component system chemotaxis response regulator CheY
MTLVRELRRPPHYQGVPVLVLTTEASTEKKQEGRSAGATGWIVKPFDPDRLLATIEKVLG